MRSTALWLFTTVVFVGASLMMGSLARAGISADHLKCYKVAKDTNLKTKEIVDLFNQQFGDEKACTLVTRAPLFCAPTNKNSKDDPRGQNLTSDFLCYNVKCAKRDRQDILVNDQFGERVITIKNARMLCTPTKKAATPPPFCGLQDTGGHEQCGGSCPQGVGTVTRTCQQSATTGDCVCLPATP